MPHRLKVRQEKIQNKRKQTPWREFVKEIASWIPVNLYKVNGDITRYPETKRKIGKLVSLSEFAGKRDNNIREDIPTDIQNFFGEYSKLFCTSYKPFLINEQTENALYTDVCAWGVENCYLSFFVFYNIKNVLYSFHVKENCNDVLNSVMVWNNSNNIYTSSVIINSYNVYFSNNIHNSSDIWFSERLIGCKHCIGCRCLENVSYYINNKKYDKDMFMQKKKELLMQKGNFDKWRTSKNKENSNILSQNVDGKFILESQNISDGLYVYRATNGKNLLFFGSESGENRENIDVVLGGSPHGNHLYGCCNLGGVEHMYLCDAINGGSNNYYSYYLINCSYCLGCIGLKNKSYCILNKQYTKEERYDKVDAIFTQMEKDGTLGKFFPGNMNPFYFNDTAAYLIDDSFTKEEVEAEGYLRRDEKIKVDIPEGAEIVYVEKSHSEGNEGSSIHKIDASTSPLNDKSEKQISPNPSLSRGEPQKGVSPLTKGEVERDLLDNYQGRKVNGKFYPISEIGNKVPKVESGAERWINPEILNKVIQDKEGNYHKIVKMEYDFLMKHGLPLPKLHWLDRIKLGFTFT